MQPTQHPAEPRRFSARTRPAPPGPAGYEPGDQQVAPGIANDDWRRKPDARGQRKQAAFRRPIDAEVSGIAPPSRTKQSSPGACARQA